MDLAHIGQRSDFFISQHDRDRGKEEISMYIEEVRGLIVRHDYQYYVLASPILSDVQYDILFSLLLRREEKYPELVTPGSPSQRLTQQPLTEFSKAEHVVPMLSILNTYSPEDIQKRGDGVLRLLTQEQQQSLSFCVEPKLDGSSLEVVYIRGKFSQAITRGNGYEGEDVSLGAVYLHRLPQFVEKFSTIASVHLRGEVVLPLSAFKQVNERLSQQGESVFSNPRNAAAGTLRQLDPTQIHGRGLMFCAHGILYSSEAFCQTQSELLSFLGEAGFFVHPQWISAKNLDEVVKVCQSVEHRKKLHEHNIETDGLVIKIDSFVLQDELGSTEHHPKRVFAFKYPAEHVATQLIDVTYQIGRTGVVTPVAILTPVKIGGATISRATLHNFDTIASLDIRLNDRVRLQRSGEVIPYIVGPIKERRTGAELPIDVPSACPSCQGPLVQDHEGVAFRCLSRKCHEKIVQQLIHFVSKDAADIRGLGDSSMEQLVQAQLVNDISDIYGLLDQSKTYQLRALPGVGLKKITSIRQEIEQAKKLELWRFLHGLSIPFVGKKVAKLIQARLSQELATVHLSCREMQKKLLQENLLKEVYGIGTETIRSLLTYMKLEETADLLLACDEQGVCLLLPQKHSENGPLRGMQIVVTGTFPLQRKQLTDLLEAAGASVSQQVTKQTSYLIYGEKAGSKKQKAEKLTIPTMSLEIFCEQFPEFAQKFYVPVAGPVQTGLFS